MTKGKTRGKINRSMDVAGVWLGVVMVKSSDLESRGRRFDSQPFHHASAQVLHTHVPLSPIRII